MITGPSGVGKGTLIEELRSRVPGLELSISATTRARRQGELEGREYHFLEPEEFERLVAGREFLEHAGYSGHRYGTLRREVEDRLRGGHPVVLEIEVQGARQIRREMPAVVQVFIAPPDPADLRRRLEGRGTDDRPAIERRLRVAEEELEARAEFEYVVVNDEIDRAAGELERIIRDELSL